MAHGDITHIDIPVADMVRAKAFYSTLFGWQIAEPPGFEGYPMWQAPNRISGGGLAPRSDDFTQPRSYVEVDSIDEALGLAAAHGGSVVMGKTPITETSWWAFISDPDGNIVGLYEGTTEVDRSEGEVDAAEGADETGEGHAS
jgi:predicted enzyme related to lactoylglutathione lyase